MKTVKQFVGLSLLVLIPGLAHADFRHDRDRDDDCRSNRYHGWSGYNGYYHPRGYAYGSSWGRNDVIRDGIRNGQLSEREARELRGDLRDIQEKRSRYLADGRLSNNERRDLRDDYQDFRKDLNHELNDGERRSYRRW